MLHEHWEKSRSALSAVPISITGTIWPEAALGGKMIGASGGGFFMLLSSAQKGPVRSRPPRIKEMPLTSTSRRKVLVNF
jgi:galactokinase/mevalonate kinase-like predicted kinase